MWQVFGEIAWSCHCTWRVLCAMQGCIREDGSSLKKLNAHLTLHAWIGIATNEIYENYHLGENTTMESLKIFLQTIRELFEQVCLKQPTQEDLEC
jgi:hypothetical protein